MYTLRLVQYGGTGEALVEAIVSSTERNYALTGGFLLGMLRNVCDTSISTLTVVNVSRNGRGALYKPLKLLTLKTRKIHLNRPFKVLYSLQLLTDKPYMQ